MESSLYLPVKRFLKKLGFEVKGEVCGCDLVALASGELAHLGAMHRVSGLGKGSCHFCAGSLHFQLTRRRRITVFKTLVLGDHLRPQQQNDAGSPAYCTSSRWSVRPTRLVSYVGQTTAMTTAQIASIAELPTHWVGVLYGSLATTIIGLLSLEIASRRN